MAQALTRRQAQSRHLQRAASLAAVRQTAADLRRDVRFLQAVARELGRRLRLESEARAGAEAEIERLSVRLVGYAAMLRIAPDVALGPRPGPERKGHQ